MIVLHLALTAWMVLPAWFYSDDFRFIESANSNSLSLDFLFTPHDSQLMPLGVAISWVVAQAGGYSWLAAASITLLLQAGAAVSCLMMLRVLFGQRWGTLVPLGVYLVSPMGLEARVWWAAGLNALPMQIAFFLLVTSVALWARERRPVWVLAAAGSVALAALSGPRGLVMAIPVSLLIALFLTTGTARQRPWNLLRQHWPLALPAIIIAAGYLTLYARTTPAPVDSSGEAPALELLRNLLAGSWAPSVLGGPWRWEMIADPVSVAAAPAVLEIASVAVVIGAVAALVRRNPTPAGYAVAILISQLAVTYVALVYGRGLQIGALAGLISRYLADSLPVTALALGLAIMPVLVAGAPQMSRPLPSPASIGPWPRRALIGTATVFIVGSLLSTARYVDPWHANFAARSYVDNAVSTLRADPTPIADLEVPELVQLAIHYPSNLPSRLLKPYGDLAQTSEQGNDLHVLDSYGRSRPALIASGAGSTPNLIPGCGVRVGPTEALFQLDPEQMGVLPWTTINYVAPADGLVEVRADGREVPDMQVAAGAHTYVLRTGGGYATLSLRSLTPGVEPCVDTVRAGPIEAMP